MKSYIQEIVNFFFHHDVSGEVAGRVYQRMISPAEDKERDEAISSIWEELEGVSCSDKQIDKAFRKLEYAIKPEKEIRMRRQTGRRNWWQVAAIWTVPFLMVGLSAYLYYKSVSIENPAVSEVTAIHHYTPVGMHEELTLSDGTHVWLNAGSLLVYPSVFEGEERSVYIYGEAFFDVAENPERPFIVNAGQLELKVLGTTFNISAYLDDLQVKATLETGQLQIKVPEHERKYVLNPGDQLIYTPLTGKVEQLRVKATDYSDWRMGGLYFNDTSLEDALPLLERAYGVKFHIRDSVYMKQRIRVHFNKDESLENILSIIRVLIPGMEYEIAGQNIYLK